MATKEDSVRERVLSLAKDGLFGSGEVVEVRNSSTNKSAQFASVVFFFDVILKSETDENRAIPIVAKIQLDGFARVFMNTDLQFANEVAMYLHVLPNLGADDLEIVPKCFHARAGKGEDFEKDIVIVENLRPLGFRAAKGLFLDNDHVSLAMEKLGHFHGLSYRLKRIEAEKLSTLAVRLKVINRGADDPDFSKIMEVYSYRGFKSTIEKDDSTDNIARKAYEKFLNLENQYERISAPEEPFAVIVHGDFNGNNMLFSYDDSNHVSAVRFFDFGTSLYADPSVDIAFFLYMNTSAEVRQKNWDEWFKIYWHGLTSVEPRPGFTFDEFVSNFSSRAIYGYLPCSFFVPSMMAEDIPESIDEWVDQGLPLEEKLEMARTIGGEIATQATSAIVQHLYNKGFLRDFYKKF